MTNRGGSVRGADRSGEDHLRLGREAFVVASKVLDDPAIIPEDQPRDAALLAKALDHYRQAAAEFSRTGQAPLEAQALLGQAEVLVRMPMNTPDARERVGQSERCARVALEKVDCAQEPMLALHGFLLLAEITRYAALARPEHQESRLRNLSALLESVAYLAQDQDDALSLARVRAEACRVLSERFEQERDENLLDAIDQGERAASFLREMPAARAFELPELLHHLGNCCMKVGGDRARWLAQGRDWYREGAATVDPGRYPRLHRLLSESVTMADALLAQRDYALPEQEMVARYGSKIQAALTNRDDAEARRLTWDFLAWAWSLPRVPNVHVGEAHKTLAKVASSFGDWEEAQDHLYHSVGVLSSLLSEQDRWFYLLQEARDLFAKILTRNGQGESLELWLTRAARSFTEAETACAHGAQLIDQDRVAALPHFEHALNVFPCHPVAHFYRGVIRMLDRDLPGALADFDLNLTLKPRSVRARVNRAGVKLGLGDRDGALADLNAAVEIDPANIDVRRMRAGLYEDRGEREEAAADLEAALRGTTDPQLRAVIEKKLNMLRSRAGPRTVNSPGKEAGD